MGSHRRITASTTAAVAIRDTLHQPCAASPAEVRLRSPGAGYRETVTRAHSSAPIPSFRALSWRGAARALLAATLTATFLVGALLPGRQDGSRDATTAFIPFRPATVPELVLLLGTDMQGLLGLPFALPDPPAAVVTRLGIDSVTVQARAYVVATPSPHLEAASWNGYVVEHEVVRADLEQALGRRFTNDDVQPPVAADRVTFRSASWVAYAAAEIALLAALFAVLAVALYVVRPLRLLPLVLELWLVALAYVGLAFSPAVWDADFFFQRVVIDQLAVYAALLAYWLAAPAAVATLVAAVAAIIRRAFASRHRRYANQAAERAPDDA